MFQRLVKSFKQSHSTQTFINNVTSDRNAVVNLLLQAKHENSLLSAVLPGQPDQYSTAILGIYPDQGILALDELSPREGHDQLIQCKELQVYGRLDGVQLRFKTQLQGSGEKSGIAFYTMDIPGKLHYLQRRQQHRVPVPAHKMTFRGQQDRFNLTLLTGYLHDISLGGLGLTLESIVPLQRGDVMPICSLRLPGNLDISFTLEIRHVFHNRRRECTRVGGRFVKLERSGRRKVARLVRSLETEQAKKRHNAQ